MEIKKVVLALASILALTACSHRGGAGSNTTTTQPDGSSVPQATETTESNSSVETTTPSETGPVETETQTSETTQTEENKVEAFLSNIYGENVVYGEFVEIANAAYPNVKGYHKASSKDGKLIGYVFIAEGTNNYGKIKMSVGINEDETVGKVFLIENGQSFADKVQNEYVDKYNKGEIGLDDVTCGATFGATLVNTMAKQALNFVKAEIHHTITDFAPYCKEIFGSDVNYIRRNNVIDPANKELKEFWTARDSENKTVGRVYRAEIEKNNIMVGVNKGGEYGEQDPNKPQTFAKVFLVNETKDEAAIEFITKVNAGEVGYEIVEGDSALVTALKTAINQAMAHAAANKITNPANIDHLLPKTFGPEFSYCEHTVIDDPANPNIIEYWNVKDANRKYVGRVYHMEAPGEHGALHVAVGVKPNGVSGGEFYKLATDAKVPTVVVPPSEGRPGVDSRPAVKALEDYINGLNDGTIDINSKDDVVCGATGTASGIRFLCLAAVAHYGDNIIADIYLNDVFGNTVSYIEHNTLENEHVREYWNVMSNGKYVGRVYHVALKGKHATIHAMVGVNMAGDFVKMHLVNRAPGEYGDKLQAYVDALNNGDVSLQDDVHNGATASSTGVRDIAKEALDHYKTSPVLPLLEDTTYVTSLFSQEVTLADHRKVSEKGYENVVEYWTVKDAEGKAIAGAYHCALPGKHAILEVTVSVIPETVNYKTTAKLGKINLLNRAPNEYGDKLQAYVDGLNDGSINIHDDVHNGATSSSNGVKDIVLQAINHLQNNSLDAGMNVASLLNNVYGEVNYGEAIAISDLAHDNLLEYWEVKNGEGVKLGRVYHGAFPGTHGVLHVLIGVNADGTLEKIFWANNPVSNPYVPENVKKYGRLAQAWIDKINSGEIKLTDDVHSGASATTSGIISLAEQALDHYTLNK